ncbi:MAG: transporter associated domain-containing protein [Ruminococcus sp.]
MGRFPKEGEVLDTEGLRFEIYKVEDRRIISIIVKVDPGFKLKVEN